MLIWEYIYKIGKPCYESLHLSNYQFSSDQLLHQGHKFIIMYNLVLKLNMLYFQPMMHEELAVNSGSAPIDVDEIDLLLVTRQKNTPGHSTRTVFGVRKDSWRINTAREALNREAQIESNCQAYEVEKKQGIQGVLCICKRRPILHTKIALLQFEKVPTGWDFCL